LIGEALLGKEEEDSSNLLGGSMKNIMKPVKELINQRMAVLNSSLENMRSIRCQAETTIRDCKRKEKMIEKEIKELEEFLKTLP